MSGDAPTSPVIVVVVFFTLRAVLNPRSGIGLLASFIWLALLPVMEKPRREAEQWPFHSED